MIKLLAAEGGYQAFHLGGVDKTWLYICLIAGIVGIVAGLLLARNVLAFDQGTPKMKEIALAVQEGAQAFLARQFRAIVMIIVPLAILIFFTATKVVKPDGGIALTFQQDGIYRVICFLFGAAFSGLTGFIGMSIAVRGNVRTAAAASKGGGMAEALRVAFRTGAVTGMLCVGLGLVGATAIVLIFQNSATAVLIGFAFGASLLALFMRVGGGIFTKAADVGADLVGKVEAGIPEDDPRNAATIADNVGDNVGDCAGMAADLFESYEITIISSLILGLLGLPLHPPQPDPGRALPAHRPGHRDLRLGHRRARGAGPHRATATRSPRSTAASGWRRVLTVVGAFLVAQYYVHDLKVFWAVLTGVVLSLVASQITEQFTSTERGPVKEIAASARTGPATTVLSGISIGLESSVWAIIAIAIAIGVAIGLGDGNIELTFYLVALIGIGLLATAGMVVSEDSFGPVSDNAAGIAEMSGEFTGEAERVMVSLDAVGNTTKAITKGVAIGSAVIAVRGALRLLHRDDRLAARTCTLTGQPAAGLAVHPDQRGQPDDLHRPAHRRLDRLPVLVAGHPRRRPLGRDRRARGAPPVPRAPGHHGLHREARVRAGHQHLHRGGPARAGHAGAAGHPVPGHRRLRHQLLRARRLPGRHHPHRPAAGQHAVELRWGVGQRQEVHRGRQRGRQGLGGPQGRRHRRHGGRPVQGHGRPGAEPDDQGHEPGLAAHPARRDHRCGTTPGPAWPSPASPW